MAVGLIVVVLGGILVIGLVIAGIIGFRDGKWRDG